MQRDELSELFKSYFNTTTTTTTTTTITTSNNNNNNNNNLYSAFINVSCSKPLYSEIN